MRRRASSAAVAIATLATLAGCGLPYEIFSQATPQAERVTALTWLMIGTSAVVYLGVMAFMLAALRRHRDRAPDSVDVSDPGTKLVLWGGVVMPAVVLTATIVASFATMGTVRRTRPVLTIDVVGHQWWWQVRYDTPALSDRVTSANEIHIPVGQPVRLRLTSADVIHSFWVPQLQGKIDIIPGDTTELDLVARTAGRYDGQCAEFCGIQHAKMRLVVVADDPAAFRAWMAHERTAGAAPADSVTQLGQRLFVGGPCSLCHMVRGTPALGSVGPDLTHVGSRLTLAAGVLPNTLGNMEGWIANAQAIKPGARMPIITQYSGEELRAVARYVESLK